MKKWKTVGYLRQGESREYDYQLVLPEPLASWDVFDYWERQRTESIRQHMKPDQVLYEVGAEHGWISAALANHCKMFLIEPTREFWPNIIQTWNSNRQDHPAGYFCGLLSDQSDIEEYDFAAIPVAANGDLIDANKYEYIHQHSEGVPTMTLDQIVFQSNIIPGGINIDVEGAEMLVLNGAKKTIKKHKPLVWVSIHPDLMQRDYLHKKEDVLSFFEKLGYEAEHLATDHEEHWFFRI